MITRFLTICLVVLVVAAPGALAKQDNSAHSNGGADTHGSDSHAADDGHGAHHDIGHGNAGDLLHDPSEWKKELAIYTFAVFLLLLAVLAKFAWPPIVEALEAREKHIADHIAGAEAKHDEAKKLLAEHEEKVSGATEEVRALLEEARRDAEHTKSTILAEAKAAAEAERDRALRDVQSATDAAMKAISERGADMAVELAGQIVQSELKAEDHAKLIRDAIGRIPEGSPSKN